MELDISYYLEVKNMISFTTELDIEILQLRPKFHTAMV